MQQYFSICSTSRASRLIGWLSTTEVQGRCGLMVMALDCYIEGLGFKSHPQLLFLSDFSKKKRKNQRNIMLRRILLLEEKEDKDKWKSDMWRHLTILSEYMWVEENPDLTWSKRSSPLGLPTLKKYCCKMFCPKV